MPRTDISVSTEYHSMTSSGRERMASARSLDRTVTESVRSSPVASVADAGESTPARHLDTSRRTNSMGPEDLEFVRAGEVHKRGRRPCDSRSPVRERTPSTRWRPGTGAVPHRERRSQKPVQGPLPRRAKSTSPEAGRHRRLSSTVVRNGSDTVTKRPGSPSECAGKRTITRTKRRQLSIAGVKEDISPRSPNNT